MHENLFGGTLGYGIHGPIVLLALARSLVGSAAQGTEHSDSQACAQSAQRRQLKVTVERNLVGWESTIEQHDYHDRQGSDEP